MQTLRLFLMRLNGSNWYCHAQWACSLTRICLKVQPTHPHPLSPSFITIYLKDANGGK